MTALCIHRQSLQTKLMQQGGEQIRRAREKHTVELRKQNREDIFLKRRQGAIVDEKPDHNGKPKSSLTYILDERYRPAIEQFSAATYTLPQLPELCKGLSINDPLAVHQAVIGLRRVISQNHNDEILQRVVDAGIVPLLINMLKQLEYPQLRLEACWILTNIASGSTHHCQSIIDKNGLDVFLMALAENLPGINEQAVWGVGNIAGDNPKLRDLVLSKGGLASLIKIVENTNNKFLISNGAWAISNLCRGSPPPKYEHVKPAIPVLAKLVISGNLEGEILSDVLWALSLNSQGQKSRIQRLVQIPNFVNSLIQLIHANFDKLAILIPGLRVLGNISTGNEMQTEEILKNEGLQLLLRVLCHPRKSNRREGSWVLSNICAGTASQVQQVIARQDLLMRLSQLFLEDELDVRREICYVFANMAHLMNPAVVHQVYLNCRVLEGLVIMINQDEDVKAIEFALHALYEALEVGRKMGSPNVVYKTLESLPGFFQRLEMLQHHKSSQLYKKVIKIFQGFFTLQDSYF